tara:strand:- start:3397 stop:3885 length:489 start_codon:yes stop_codon:yes gene_type:complete
MNRFITFVVIFSIWLLWSGLYDSFHIALGIISSIIVVSWTGHLFTDSHKDIITRIIQWVRFEKYGIWLLWQIVLANIEVFKLAFHPKVLTQLNPKLISFQTRLKGDVAKYMFAQSITLTPGTVTVRIHDNEIKVHAINDDAASALPGEMQDRIAKIYKEDMN